MLINSYRYAPPLPVYPLDPISGTTFTGVYALRRMLTSYTGNLIKVRRSSDNATQDIGYDADGILDTAALTSFIGANSGAIDTWYDQSGLGYDMAQATTANQPLIISSGTLQTQGGKPSVLFDGSNDELRVTGAGLAWSKDRAGLSAMVICRNVADATARYPFAVLGGTASSVARVGMQKNTNNTLQAVGKALDADSGLFGNSASASTTVYSFAVLLNFLESRVITRRNAVETHNGTNPAGSTAGNTSNTDALAVRIGARGTNSGAGTNFFNGHISELLFMNTFIDNTIYDVIDVNQQAYFGF